jgi:hypothetical protein
MHDYTENNLIRFRRQLSSFYGEDNLVMMTDQFNQNLIPTWLDWEDNLVTIEKRLIKIAKSFRLSIQKTTWLDSEDNLVMMTYQLNQIRNMCVNNIHTIASYTEMEVKRLASKVKSFALHKLS